MASLDILRMSPEDVKDCYVEVSGEVDEMFKYHPWDSEQVHAGEYVRMALAEAVKKLLLHVPPCPDRSTAIRKIREARMDANSAITSGGKY